MHAHHQPGIATRHSLLCAAGPEARNDTVLRKIRGQRSPKDRRSGRKRKKSAALHGSNISDPLDFHQMILGADLYFPDGCQRYNFARMIDDSELAIFQYDVVDCREFIRELSVENGIRRLR